jgi:hypothetical protein
MDYRVLTVRVFFARVENAKVRLDRPGLGLESGRDRLNDCFRGGNPGQRRRLSDQIEGQGSKTAQHTCAGKVFALRNQACLWRWTSRGMTVDAGIRVYKIANELRLEAGFLFLRLIPPYHH